MEGDEDYYVCDTCPYCGTHYDEIDLEFQICSVCGYENTGERDTGDSDESTE